MEICCKKECIANQGGQLLYNGNDPMARRDTQCVLPIYEKNDVQVWPKTPSQWGARTRQGLTCCDDANGGNILKLICEHQITKSSLLAPNSLRTPLHHHKKHPDAILFIIDPLRSN
jgi:hypothetical protein